MILFKTALRFLAFKKRQFIPIYVKLCKPSGLQYAELLKHHRYFYKMGENCSIIPGTYIGDAKYIKIGNNVRLANCTLFAHDGVANMLSVAYGHRLDAVGKIEIGSNVFIGQGAQVMRNVEIGDNCVIAAGSVVTKNVPSNSVVGGIPAKVITSTDKLYSKLREETLNAPWHDIVSKRTSGYDPKLEPALYELRIKHFFSSEN